MISPRQEKGAEGGWQGSRAQPGHQKPRNRAGAGIGLVALANSPAAARLPHAQAESAELGTPLTFGGSLPDPDAFRSAHSPLSPGEALGPGTPSRNTSRRSSHQEPLDAAAGSPALVPAISHQPLTLPGDEGFRHLSFMCFDRVEGNIPILQFKHLKLKKVK